MPTQKAPAIMPMIAITIKETIGGAWLRTSGIAIAAEAKPPITSAPSPPIMTSPIRAGTATASAVRISGAERCSVFCNENAVPKPPRLTSSKNSSGDFPSASRNSENNAADTTNANSGMAMYSAPRLMRTDRSLGAFAGPTSPALSGSAMSAMCPGGIWPGGVTPVGATPRKAQVIEPTTPSSR